VALATPKFLKLLRWHALTECMPSQLSCGDLRCSGRPSQFDRTKRVQENYFHIISTSWSVV